MKKRTISAAIITLNESRNIKRLLKSLYFCDEIVVVDTGSTDDTVSIARKMGAKIKKIKFKDFSHAKNTAVSACRCDYILSVDADEEISENLAKKIISEINSESALDGYWIKRDTYFLGRIIKHCGWGGDYQLRLFKRGKGKFDGKQVHESLIVEGKTGRIFKPIIHYSYPDSFQYFEKMNRYTSIQAKTKKSPFIFLKMIFSPAFKFIKMYFLKLGFMDGFQGFILCAYSALSEFVKFSKTLENKLKVNDFGKFALRAPNWLGDAVMSTALIKSLCERHGEIFVICNDAVKRVYEGIDGIKEIISFDKKNFFSYLSAVIKIKKAGIITCVNLSPSLSAGFMLFAAGVKTRCGFDEDSLFMNVKVKRDKTHSCCHIIEEFAEICSAVDGGFSRFNLVQKLAVNEEDSKIIQKHGLKNKNYVVFAPFSAYGAAKMWPAEKWEVFLDKVSDKFKNILFVMLGTKKDSHVFFKNRKNLVDLRGRTSVGEAFALIKSARVFAGNDSGLMHVADALNVPSVGIFASSSPLWTGMRSKYGIHVKSNEKCSPCFENKCRFGHYDCMKNIGIDEVYNAFIRAYFRQK